MTNNPNLDRGQTRQILQELTTAPLIWARATDPWTRGTYLFASAIAAMFLCSCATTAIKSTWKSPDFKGRPVQKVAVLAVTDQPRVRPALENRFANQLERRGQPAITTVKLLSLAEIKESKDAAAERLRQAGADSVLITRLVSQSTYESKSRQTPNEFYSLTTGSPSEGWYTYYLTAYSGTDPAPLGLRDRYLLDTSLFDLNTGKRLWSCLTETEVKENSDRLEIADALVAKVVELMGKDGVVR